ncbi:hypothetical protein JG687_00015620 [Phytophthora cactorum]|uniref:Uncharacterized protein n=1 Tax=Phytophthora cactorum TaxID=29920 RepID=A0A8T1TYB1_9STRA|nr:hypothetical protein PC123_g23214 [Phytophthora cactorum]KAG6948222.1 hypothetical protein JG687_00015620 [Phytophthora cactorum]
MLTVLLYLGQTYDWADSTTKEWTKADQGGGDTTAAGHLRVLKKNEFIQMQREREYLESQVKKCLATMNSKSLLAEIGEVDTKASELYRTVHRLALECDALRTENVELKKEIYQAERFQYLI